MFVCGITARHSLTRSCAPGTRLLYVCSPRASGRRRSSDRMSPGSVTWVRVRMHTTARPAPARAHVATRALWQRIAHARSLAVVLGMAHLRQPVSFDSTVPRVDLARVGHVYQQLPRVSCRVRRSMSACGGLHDEPQAASWSILRHACTAAWLSLWAHKDGHAVTCVRPGPNIAVRVEFTSWPARYPHRREMKQVKIVKRISCACYLS